MSEFLNVKLAELGISPSALSLRGLVPFGEAAELVTVQVDSDGRVHCLMPAAAAAWQAMRRAALDQGIELTIVSAFRSIERQVEIIQRKLGLGMNITEILDVSAAPGYSEHHTGRAIDVAVPGGPVLETEFEQTDAFEWLSVNANAFAFYLSYPMGNEFGYLYEPWHWCYKTSNMVLDIDALRLST
jgi:zinc D-Ala-D-Ala carboxypeptidase